MTELTIRELVKKLSEWECRQDHDFGPGYVLDVVLIHLFGDGSGKIMVELNRRVTRHSDKRVNNLLTNLGVVGRIEKPITFESIDHLIRILSEPIKLQY